MRFAFITTFFALSVAALPTGSLNSKRDPQGLLQGVGGLVDGLVGGLVGSPRYGPEVIVVPQPQAYPPGVVIVNDGRGGRDGGRDHRGGRGGHGRVVEEEQVQPDTA